MTIHNCVIDLRRLGTKHDVSSHACVSAQKPQAIAPIMVSMAPGDRSSILPDRNGAGHVVQGRENARLHAEPLAAQVEAMGVVECSG